MPKQSRRLSKRHHGTNPHFLIYSEPGHNRWIPGIYVCDCGDIFPAVLKFEQHRAQAIKAMSANGAL